MTDLSEPKSLVYKAKHKIRFVTAASLFDGHDASINIMRRILQASGTEVIHLGHNRSVEDVVSAALHEDVQDAAHDVDRGVVAVEQAGRGDEADLVLRLVDEALGLGQVGHAGTVLGKRQPS